MRSPPRKLATEEQLYQAALRALMRRAHSVYEMRQALERRLPTEAGAEGKTIVGRVLGRLKEQKLLDDARYTQQFARYRAESRRQGRYRIARDLRARGVHDRHIEVALEEIFSETDEAALVRQRLERHLKSLRGRGARDAALNQRRLASLYRSLLRAGFSRDVIRRELRALTKKDVPEFEDTETAED